MIVLGLTGSIGMGKSTVAAMFEALGVPVHSADASVHALYAGAAAPLVEAAFPGTVREGVVDRLALSKRVLGDAAAMARLEAIVHPLVRGAETAFLEAARASGAPLVVLDIPLLYETGGEARCDRVAVVSAPPETQRARVLARPDMTAERLEAILAKQMPDAQKRQRADIVIDTGASLEETRAAVERIVGEIRERAEPGG